MAAGKRRRKRRSRKKIWIAAVLCLAAVTGVVWAFGKQQTEGAAPVHETPPGVTVPVETVSQAPSVPETASPEPTVPVVPETTSPEPTVPVVPETTSPEPTVPVEETPAVKTSAPDGKGSEYDFSNPVPESEAAPEDYFSDAAFLGDSRTDGLLLYSGIKGATGLSYKGLMISELEDKKVKFTVSGITDTVMGALGKTSYGKVYMMFGVNELGWYNDQKFYETYTQEVQRVKELQPGAVIYLQSIIPVTQSKSDSHAYFTNENIARYNAIIQQVAEEQEVYYLDVASALVDESGALPEEGSTDGIHMTRSYYKLWYQYLQTHTVTP